MSWLEKKIIGHIMIRKRDIIAFLPQVSIHQSRNVMRLLLTLKMRKASLKCLMLERRHSDHTYHWHTRMKPLTWIWRKEDSWRWIAILCHFWLCNRSSTCGNEATPNGTNSMQEILVISVKLLMFIMLFSQLFRYGYEVMRKWARLDPGSRYAVFTVSNI